MRLGFLLKDENICHLRLVLRSYKVEDVAEENALPLNPYQSVFALTGLTIITQQENKFLAFFTHPLQSEKSEMDGLFSPMPIQSKLLTRTNANPLVYQTPLLWVVVMVITFEMEPMDSYPHQLSD